MCDIVICSSSDRATVTAALAADLRRRGIDVPPGASHAQLFSLACANPPPGYVFTRDGRDYLYFRPL